MLEANRCCTDRMTKLSGDFETYETIHLAAIEIKNILHLLF